MFEDLTSSLCSELLLYQTLSFFHFVCESTCLVKGEVSSSEHGLGVCYCAAESSGKNSLFQMFAEVICPPEEKFTLGQRG